MKKWILIFLFGALTIFNIFSLYIMFINPSESLQSDDYLVESSVENLFDDTNDDLNSSHPIKEITGQAEEDIDGYFLLTPIADNHYSIPEMNIEFDLPNDWDLFWHYGTQALVMVPSDLQLTEGNLLPPAALFNIAFETQGKFRSIGQIGLFSSEDKDLYIENVKQAFSESTEGSEILGYNEYDWVGYNLPFYQGTWVYNYFLEHNDKVLVFIAAQHNGYSSMPDMRKLIETVDFIE